MAGASTRIRFVCFGLSAALAIYIGFFAFRVERAVHFVREFGYWFILITVALLVAQLIGFSRTERPQPLSGWKMPWQCLRKRRVWMPLLGILLISLVAWVSQPAGFKIIMDEPVLAATSMQMHLEKEALAPMRAYEIEGVFLPLAGLVDKRPLFFPFLLSLMHDLTGYRPSQGLYLNALLLPVFLGQCFFLSKRLAAQRGNGQAGGYLAIGMWLTVPLLAMVATSGGFDLLNLVMLLLTVILAERYLAAPSDRNLNLLLLVTVLLAQTRYESVLFVFSTAVVVAFGGWRERRLRLTWTAVAVPLLLVIYPMQRKIVSVYEGFWQMRESFSVPFSLSFIPENVFAAVDFFFALNTEQPNSLLLSVLWLLSIPVIGLGLWDRRRRLRETWGRPSPGIIVSIAFGGIVVANFIILLTYHWGQINDIMATRLVLPVLLLQVFCVTFALRFVSPWRTPVCLSLGASLLIFFISVTRPVEARTNFLPWALGQQYVNWLMDASAVRQGQDTLWITERHLVPILNQASAFTPEDALQSLPGLELHWRIGTFDEILVVYLLPTKLGRKEKLSDLKGAKAMRRRLEDAFGLELEKEVKLNDLAYLRLMRVTDIRVTATDRLSLSVEGISLDYTGRLEVRNPDLLKSFVESLPR